MNTKPSTVKALARLMQETGLTSLEIQENDCIIKLEKAPVVQQNMQPAPQAVVPSAPAVSTPRAGRKPRHGF